MPYIVSAGTFLTGFFSGGVQSVNISQTPQINNLYQLGSAEAYDRTITIQRQLSATVYGGASTSTSLPVSTDCTDSSSVNLNFSAQGCGSIGNISLTGQYFITSYSYSKDGVAAVGTESWSFVSKPIFLLENGTEIPVTAVQLRGQATGQTTTDGGANTGVTFGTFSLTSAGSLGSLRTVQASAGAPGIGRAYTLQYGDVTAVGGADGINYSAEGGNASVSVPYTTIYI